MKRAAGTFLVCAGLALCLPGVLIVMAGQWLQERA